MNAQPVRTGCHCIRLLIWFGAVFLTSPLLVIPVQATTVVAPGFNQLVGQADYIVRAVVKSVDAKLHDDGVHRHITTKVELQVLEIISGTPPQPLVLQLLGGKVGLDEMVVDGTPKFQVGDEDILFVHANGTQFCPLVALLHGRYPIKQEMRTGRRYVARGDGTPLSDEREVSYSLSEVDSRGAKAPAVGASAVALAPADFVARIKAAVLVISKSTQVQP